MTMTMRTYAIGLGLSAMLALAAAIGFDQLSTQPVAAGVAGHVAQYCAPPHDNPDALRFFCRDEVGCPAPTGAAAFACSM
jgi:hypothetical protein